MDKDFICICEHTLEKHEPYSDSEEVYCEDCWNSDIANELLCTRFVADNLKYLEAKFKENHYELY